MKVEALHQDNFTFRLESLATLFAIILLLVHFLYRFPSLFVLDLS
jgi:hypothetical protein